MKKIFILILGIAFYLPTICLGAGSCVETVKSYTGGHVYIDLTCTGDAAGATPGTIPTQTLSAEAMALIQGTHYLYRVVTKPTAGGTAPDAADVTVNMDGQDVLGAKGVNLIHATATQDTLPYSTFMSSYRYPPVKSQITVGVANQATAGANWTLSLEFVR